MPTDPTHPSDAAPAHPLDQPVTPETGAKVLAMLALTEGEALALLGARPASDAELAVAQRVDLHALALGLEESTVHALVTDPKVDLGVHADDFEPRAARVRVAASAEAKLQHSIDSLHNSTRLDASTAQEVLNLVVPALRARTRLNANVTKTYSTLLAYQHARFPGHRGPQEPKK